VAGGESGSCDTSSKTPAQGAASARTDAAGSYPPSATHCCAACREWAVVQFRRDGVKLWLHGLAWARMGLHGMLHAAAPCMQPLTNRTFSANPSRVTCSSSARWWSASSASASHTAWRNPATARRWSCWRPRAAAAPSSLPSSGADAAGAERRLPAPLAISTHRFCRVGCGVACGGNAASGPDASSRQP
jgi:hypothetical protein